MGRFDEVGKTLDIHDLEKSRRNITRIIVHCSATPEGRYHNAQDIHRWHKERGWAGIGYHYVLMLSGELQQGRSIHYTGAHAKGYNKNSLAICLIGGTDSNLKPKEDSFTVEQKLFLESFLIEVHAMYPNAEILGHRDLPGVSKACPCLEVSDIWLGDT